MNIKKDCFAYSVEHRECKALTKVFCKEENCKFYKTKEEFLKSKKEAEEKAYERGKYKTDYEPL